MSATPHGHLTQTSWERARGVDRPPEAAVMQVVAVRFTRGEGCCEADPVRIVTAYYDLDGNILAERDTWLASRDSATDGLQG